MGCTKSTVGGLVRTLCGDEFWQSAASANSEKRALFAWPYLWCVLPYLNSETVTTSKVYCEISLLYKNFREISNRTWK